MINKNTNKLKNRDKSRVLWTKVFLLHKKVDKCEYIHNFTNIK